MGSEILIFIVAGMILYDWSIHLVYLLNKENFFLKRGINYWPNWDRWGKKERQSYQIFWSTYWGTAFILTVAYLLLQWR